jgi:hypothetical protein
MNISLNFDTIVPDSHSNLIFFLGVCMYLMQVLTKFHCPKFKTFVLAGFLREHIKVKKFGGGPTEPHGIPAEEAKRRH